MKKQILLGLSALMIAWTAYGGVAEGTGQTESEACRSAKNKIPSTEKASNGCFCDEPIYDGGLWDCRVTHTYDGYSGSDRQYLN